MPPNRFSRQIQQEQVSRKQIEERLVEFGWVPSTPLDLGEDFIIHIYLDRQATGIVFHVQAKSITNIVARKKGAYLTYTLKSKDLKHWEKFSSPVVLVIWDVKLREGRWTLVSTILAELDKNRPKWRNNKTGVDVHIPWDNALTDQGLVQLKQAVGRHFYPQISSGKDFEIKAVFSFPKTQEGQEILETFERHIKEGEPVILKGRTIQELHFPEWWEQWFGGYDPDAVELHLGQLSSSSTLPVNIDIIANNGEVASISNVIFRVIQAGTEFVKIISDHPTSPLRFSVIIRKQETSLHGNFSFTSHRFSHSIDETRNILKFLQAVAVGGKMRLTFTSLENQILETATEPQPDAAPNLHLVSLIDKLVTIQAKIGRFLPLPDQGVSIEDIKAINELHEILEFGSTTLTNATATIEIKGEVLCLMLDVHRQSKPIHLRLTAEESFVELFGIQIPTGQMIRDMTGFIELSVSELEKSIADLATDQFLSIKVIRATVTESFPKWTPHQVELSEKT